MSVDISLLQSICDRLESKQELSQIDLETLASAIRSRQITLATGDSATQTLRERAVAIAGSADSGEKPTHPL